MNTKLGEKVEWFEGEGRGEGRLVAVTKDRAFVELADGRVVRKTVEELEAVAVCEACMFKRGPHCECRYMKVEGR